MAWPLPLTSTCDGDHGEFGVCWRCLFWSFCRHRRSGPSRLRTHRRRRQRLPQPRRRLPHRRPRSSAPRAKAGGYIATRIPRQAWRWCAPPARLLACSARRGGMTTPGSGCRTVVRASSSRGRRRRQRRSRSRWSTSPTFGFRLYSGEKGEIYFRLFSYVRYLNQRNIDASYTDSFGVQHTVQQRQDVQLAKFFSPFAGWFLTPKFRYYLYVWSSNASQGIRRKWSAAAI